MNDTLALLFSPVALLGRTVLSVVAELGGFCIFLFQGLYRIVAPRPSAGKIVQQVYFIGVKSIFVIVLIGLFTGMVLGLQGYYTLVKFGSEGLLGAAVALSIIRELGPVLTAIMITGRAGSSMAAEIGIMRISEQIDALWTMGINPMRYLIAPKLAASLICFPRLTGIFDVVGIGGGYLTGVVLLGINPAVYFDRIDAAVELGDVTSGFVKSLVFALLVAAICCYEGYFTHARRDGFGAKGVSLATTAAVVVSCVTILVADYVLTSFLL
ncbi:ABC transporter permease [Solidesulfovibrio sp.]|uniref:MlaE family ABC transporter permease n=1 Tax=Solidesulfovibrio sp. TaxID=2910990 RepID=UPI002B1F9C2D|nr:ABC transporter permease [Solidesulfovibrio sp.]MEA4858023.1 ABC transporter permease [Solidesulfovibrio sp.]